MTALLVAPEAAAASSYEPAGDDPRIRILQLRLDGRPTEAVESGESLRREQPEVADTLGIDLAVAAAYEQQQRWHDAFDFYERALSSTTPLYRRFAGAAVARLHLRLERPDSAASFARRGLDGDPPWADALVATLVSAVRLNHDCGQLTTNAAWNLDEGNRRRLRLAAAECRLDQNPDDSVAELSTLIAAEQRDLVASEAALLLFPHRHQLSDSALRSLAEALHHHRLFDRSTQLFDLLLSHRENADQRYKLARGYFWLGDYQAAADQFQRYAAAATESNERAQAWFQRGRSLELDGQRDAALVAFRRAYDAAPIGSWASAALLSTLRLEVMAGRDDEAGRLYRLLASRGGWRKLADRAALFLASTDISRGRADRARGWLSRSAVPEFAYWKGRLAELNGASDEALAHYLELADDPMHPLTSWASMRLQGELSELGRARARQLMGSSRIGDLRRAAMLLEGDERATVITNLRAAAADTAGGLWQLEPAPVASWPLWSETLNEEDALLRLGLVPSDASVRRWFPVEEPDLALAGIDLLYLDGRHRAGLRTAEVLANSLRRRLTATDGLLPEWLLRRLYPRPFLTDIQRQAVAFGIDKDLLLGLIRQESRFDPQAVSAVSARGLAQFVVATAEASAKRAQIPELTAPMLHRPEIAIRLAAAHLSQLVEDLDADPAVLAAYNAGLPQASLWADYSVSDDPVEYFSKVGFSQTHDYIVKVLGNRNRYRALYGESDA